MTFPDKLTELIDKATKGTWHVGYMESPDGHALAWLGNTYIDTDAPKIKGTRYEWPEDDAKLIVYLVNHAEAIRDLVVAAEDAVKDFDLYEEYPLHKLDTLQEALAKLEEA